MIAALEQARRRRITALAAIVLIAALAIAFLASPWGASRTALQIERDSLFRRVQAEQMEVAPLRDIDKKIGSARDEIAAFEQDRLPADYSSISDTLYKLAAENRVQVSGIQYRADKDVTEGLRRIDMQATIAAPYPDLVRFINGMERAKMFFIIDGVSLQEQEAGTVRLQINFETYQRGAA